MVGPGLVRMQPGVHWARPGFFYADFLFEQGHFYLFSERASAKKDLTKIINRGTIPYNLKRKENYGLFSIKNTRRYKQKITAHTVTDQPEPEEGGGYPFRGENGAYELCGCDGYRLCPLPYLDVKRNQHLEGDLYCR